MRGLLDLLESERKETRISVERRQSALGAVRGQFLPAFLAVTRTDYGAELARLDFAQHAEESRQTINQWVEDQTAGKIKDLILSAAASSGRPACLDQCRLFQGGLDRPFQKELDEGRGFSALRAADVKAPLMHTRHRFRYPATDGVQILELPYGDGSLSMIALLPEKQDGLADLEAG